jgi:predicted nucleic acid-binding Zn ribbon protein
MANRTDATRRCLWCSAPIQGDPRKIYCSTRCKHAVSNANTSRQRAERRSTLRCAWCEQPIPVVDRVRRYCSARCASRANYLRNIEANRARSRAKYRRIKELLAEFGISANLARET